MEVANYDSAFAAFQDAVAALPGDSKPILKFQKGDWYVGQDDEELPPGTRLAADMMRAEWGWVRWKDGKPAERRMVLVASGRQPEPRDALGHLDEAMWDRDAQGRPLDPWQRMIELPVREVAGERREFILSGGSRGHEAACKALFKSFGEGMRANIGKVPVIELRDDKYNHRTYGIVKVPAMPLVEWATRESLEAVEASMPKLTKF